MKTRISDINSCWLFTGTGILQMNGDIVFPAVSHSAPGSLRNLNRVRYATRQMPRLNICQKRVVATIERKSFVSPRLPIKLNFVRASSSLFPMDQIPYRVPESAIYGSAGNGIQTRSSRLSGLEIFHLGTPLSAICRTSSWVFCSLAYSPRVSCCFHPLYTCTASAGTARNCCYCCCCCCCYCCCC